MFDVNVYLRQSYHGIKPKDAKVCGVVEYQTKKGPATYSFTKKAENVTAHRLALLGIVEAMKILKKPCELHISTDDKYIVDMWDQGLPDKRKNIENLYQWTHYRDKRLYGTVQKGRGDLKSGGTYCSQSGKSQCRTPGRNNS